MKLFDPKAYHLHTQRAKKTFHTHNFLFEHVGNELVSRLQDLKKTFASVLNLSPHPLPCLHTHHRRAGEKSHENNVFLGNKHFLNFSSLKDHFSLQEQSPYPEASFDLIFSCLQAHWVNDLPRLLKSIHSSLEKDGLFLGALWGGQTLFELRESLLQAELQLTGGASPRVSPMIHPADAPQLLGHTGFFSPVVDTETITVTYPTLLALMKDLRGMGETNKLHDRPKTFTSRLLFEKAEEIYSNTFGTPDHTLPATFEVIYLTGWKA